MALERAIDAGMARRLFPPGSGRTLYLLRVVWADAVGDELSRRTEVLAIEGNTLRVMIPTGGWKKVLHRLSPQILARLRRVLGDLAPRRLGFTEGLVADPGPGPSSPPETTLTKAAPPDSLVEAARDIADPEIRALFLETAALYFERSRNA
jgi:hypothetical protein